MLDGATLVALADRVGSEAEMDQVEEAELLVIALLDQSEAEAEAETILLSHSDEEADPVVLLADADSVGGDVGEAEAASVDTDGRLEL